MSTAQSALQDIKNKKFWPVYYLYGDEPYKLQEFLSKTKEHLFAKDKNQNYDIQKLDGAQTTSEDILDALQSMSLFSSASEGSNKVVIVQQAQQLKNVDAIFTRLQEMKKDNASWNGSLLFLVAENLDGRKKFHQWLKKSGYAIEFKKAYDSELSQWLQYMSKKLGITLDREATDLLLIASDGSLQRLEQELQKAWLYSGAEAKTELKQIHVSQVASSHVTHEMIEFVEAVLQKKKTKSLLFVDKLIQTSEDALGLVGFLVWALKNPSRTQSSQNKKSVARMLEQLIELDYKLKRSGMDAKLLVENFILKVCG